MMNYSWGWPNHMWGWGIFSWLPNVLFWAVFIWVIVSLIKSFKSEGKHLPHDGVHETPLDIAKMRYAKGEITKKEFDEMKKDLKE